MTSTRPRLLRMLVAALGGLLVATACGSSGDDTSSSSGGSSGGGSSGGGSSGGSSSGGSSGSDRLPGTSGGLPPSEALGDCVAKETVRATLKPLDVLIMFDTSDSMNDQVAQGKSKYQATSDAVIGFLNDKRSEGIGAGLSFFPEMKAGTPATCTTGSCPSGYGPCSQSACDQNGPLYFCDGKSECASNKCTVRGRCANAANAYCPTIGVPCGKDANGFDLGMCQVQTSSWCTGADSCNDADYATPALPIAPLPGSASAISTALTTHPTPRGGTPTYAALKGALASLQAWAATHPDHTLALIFATDGGPQQCSLDKTAIGQLAADALASPAHIRTFVVGLFGSMDGPIAKPYMDEIAQKGGTLSPYIVAPDSSTTQKLLDAFDAIRGAALPCDYDVPRPAGGLPDFAMLNVQYTPASGPTVVYPHRNGAAACDQNGGWHYDADPPTKLSLCPVTCDAVKSLPGQMDILMGCKTVVR